jgi:hypothetical protein
MLDDCDDVTEWTAASDSTVTPVYNAAQFVEGDAALKFSIPAASTTKTLTWTKPAELTLTAYADGTMLSENDYIAFYLYRLRKDTLYSLTMQVNTDTGKYYTATLVQQTLSGTQPVLSPYYTAEHGRTFIAEWDNDKYDNRVFLVKVRMADMITTTGGSWADGIDSIVFTAVSAGSSFVSATKPCEFIIDYLHIRRHEPVARTMGWPVLRCNATEYDNPAGGTVTWSGTNYSFTNYPSVDGSALNLHTAGANATLTFSTARNFIALEDGSSLKGRDRLSVWLATETGWLTKVKIDFKYTGTYSGSSGTYTASATFLVARKKGGVRKERPLWAMWYTHPASGAAGNAVLPTFIAGVADKFDWSLVTSITITRGSAHSENVYVDDILIRQTGNTKVIHKFEAVDVRAVDAIGEMIEPFLADRPVMQDIADRAGELWMNAIYRTKGDGHLTYPDTEFAEWGRFSTASMRITAGAEEDSDALDVSSPNSWQKLGDALFEGDGSGGGCMVWWARPAKYLSAATYWGYLDLTQYYKYQLSIPDTAGTGFATKTYTAEADDNDQIRIWTHIDKPQNLAKIVFRLYYDAAKSTNTGDNASWSQVSDSYFNLPVLGSEGHYYEYTFDASTLVDKRTSEAMEWAGIEQYATQDEEKLQIPVPWGGNLSVDPHDATAWLMGKDTKDYAVPNYSEKKGLTTVLTWKRGDMMQMSQNVATVMNEDATTPTVDSGWAYIVGYSIRVVPVAGKSVAVSFDNWEMRSSDPLDGVYYYKCTYVDSFGIESAATDSSRPVFAKGKKVYIASLPVPSTSSNIDLIKLYRIGGNSTQWRLVAALSPTTTVYIDDKEDSELGPIMPEDAYAPPRCRTMALINGRMWYGNCKDRFNIVRPYRLMYADQFYPGRVPDQNAIDIEPGDGQVITAITSLQGYPIVFKDNSVYTLDPNTMQPLPRDRSVGCIATHSIATDSTHVYFLSRQGVRRFDLQQVDREVGRAIDPYFQALTDSQLKTAVGFIHNDTYWIFVTSSGTAAATAHAYDIPQGIWTQHTIGLGSTQAINVGSAVVTTADCTDMTSIDANQIYLGATAYGSAAYKHGVLRFLSGDTDFNLLSYSGTLTISSLYRTGDYDFGAPTDEKRLTTLFVRAKYLSSGSTYTITPYVEQTAVTYGGAAWTISSAEGFVTGALPATYQTKRFVPNQGAHGYIHSVYITGTGRIGLSKVAGLYTRMLAR